MVLCFDRALCDRGLRDLEGSERPLPPPEYEFSGSFDPPPGELGQALFPFTVRDDVTTVWMCERYDFEIGFRTGWMSSGRPASSILRHEGGTSQDWSCVYSTKMEDDRESGVFASSKGAGSVSFRIYYDEHPKDAWNTSAPR